MTFLRALWELLTGRLLQRIELLEQDRAALAAHYNQHVSFTRSKIQALTDLHNGTRAQVLEVAQRIGEREQQTTVYRAFGDDDDEKTYHITDEDIVMPRGKR